MLTTRVDDESSGEELDDLDDVHPDAGSHDADTLTCCANSDVTASRAR